MPDIDLEIRLQLLRARPDLSPARADTLIRSVASDFLDIRADEAAQGSADRSDFFTFSQTDGAALVAIFKGTEVEFLAFAADESLIHEAERLGMADVHEFLQMACSRFRLPEAGLVLPISQALPWMAQHRKSN
jgi:hypothetical protein